MKPPAHPIETRANSVPKSSFPSSEQRRDFHGILCAAESTGVALDLDGHSIVELELQLEEQSRLTDRDDHWTNGLPESYAAALTAFALTEHSDLALDRINLKHSIDTELNSVTRSTWLYVALMFFVAAFGMAVFAEFSTPAIQSMRVDLELMPRQSNVAGPNFLSPGFSANRLQWIAIMCLILSAGLVVMVSSTRFAAWSVAWLGGAQYRATRAAALNEQITRSIGHHESVSHLSSNYLRSLASMRLVRLRIVAPLFLIVVLGGSGVMTYCWLLFSPLISLIYELSNSMAWSIQ